MGEMKDTTTIDLTAQPNDAANDAYGMFFLNCLTEAWFTAEPNSEESDRLVALMAALGYC
jgi:hypothetical protein